MPVYQIEPSEAASGSCGREFGVGTSHSLNVTGVLPVVTALSEDDAGLAGALFSGKFLAR